MQIPHASEQLSPGATAIEPVLWSPGGTAAALEQEKPLQREACTTAKTQHSQIINKYFLKKRVEKWLLDTAV